MAHAHTPPSILPLTIGTLRASGWQSFPVKEELRRNAVKRIAAGLPLFEGVLGYEDTVMPQLENALLAGHDVIFLGERGQAKTRIIRSLTGLLDEWMPIIAGSEINDDPYNAVSRHARELVAAHGDDTPIAWVHSSDRYGEKLATPDTSVSDLIGEVDPIKVAEAAICRTNSRFTTASCRVLIVPFLRSTNCPTWLSEFRSACSTCSKSAMYRFVATKFGCHST